MAKKPGKFKQGMHGNERLSRGGRKADSNYYRRHIKGRKVAYISQLIENVNQLMIVSSVAFPEYKSGLVDRFLVLAHSEGVEPFIVISKMDLLEEDEFLKEDIDEQVANYRELGYIVILVDNTKGIGQKAVGEKLANRNTAIVGHSGVGKTTLLNAIDPLYSEAVQEVSSFTKRGRHTTTSIRRHELAIGGEVYDMPGLKELDFFHFSRREVQDYFPEMHSASAHCQFRDCLHWHEESCEVKKQVEAETILLSRYESYIQIVSNLAEV